MKRLLGGLRSLLDDQFLCLVQVNPLGEDNGIDLVLIHPIKGIICINEDRYHSLEHFSEYYAVTEPIWTNRRQKLLNKLQSHRYLLGPDGKLKVDVSWIRYFSELKKQDMPNKEVISGDFLRNVRDGKLDSLEKVLTHHKRCETPLTDDEVNTFIHQMAPEYTIPRRALGLLKEYYDVSTPTDLSLKQDDELSRVLRLDQQQVALVNDITVGDQLMLACAGSGKSALLIAKAFKTAALNPNKKVLITCYNRNLAQFYDWQIDVAGFRQRNVECLSFHALCRHLLDVNNIRFPISSDDMYDEIFRLADAGLHSGQISQRYYAVFIDEVQIFKREWYKFCYNLLENKNDVGHVFVVCGDKSQNVNDNVQKGLAPWMVSDDGYPKFQKSVRIETNYRNSVPINSYINKFVSISRSYFDKFDISISEDRDIFLRGKATRPGPQLVVAEADRSNEKDAVLRSIKTMNEVHKVPLSDIAVIMPYKHYSPLRYRIFDWIEGRLALEGIPHSRLVSTDTDWATRYGDRDGVSLVTIESALGLDFEAVILCGLYPLGFYGRAHRLTGILNANLTEDERELQKTTFFKAINQLYTAMSRARNLLHIVLSQPSDSNIYSSILADACREGVDTCCKYLTMKD